MNRMKNGALCQTKNQGQVQVQLTFPMMSIVKGRVLVDSTQKLRRQDFVTLLKMPVIVMKQIP